VLPDFVVIGAQKSGSTFFHECLREHPDIFMPPGETRFFEDPEYLQTDISRFEAMFDAVPGEKVIGIKRPDYLAKPECPARIHKHIPNAKLVAILRNPVERAISAYFHEMRQSFIPIQPLNEGLRRIIAGEYKDSYPKSEEIIEYGFYYRHLKRYLDYFHRDQILVILFDTLKSKPLESVRRAYGFLGVNATYTPQSKRSRGAGVYDLPRITLLRIPNSFMHTYNSNRTKRYQKQPKPLLGRLIKRAVTSADRLLLAPTFGNSKPELDVQVADDLFKLYEQDINSLEDFLGQKLTAWKSYAAFANPR
jgi:hypothetical protein